MANGRFTYDDLFRHVTSRKCDVDETSPGVYRITSKVRHSDPPWAVVTSNDPAGEELG